MIKEIPLRPHVKAFLLKQYGPEPVHVHLNSDLGKLILLVTEKHPFRQLNKEAAVRHKSALQIKLPVALKHQTITTESLKRLGEYLDKFFNDQFIMYMIGQTAVTENENFALTMFYRTYEIDPDDYDLDALRKVWRDHKDKVQRANQKMLKTA